MLRLSAGAAAVAVPITALSVVSGGSSALSPAPIKKLTEAEIKRSGTGRVMLCVHDASRGEISILGDSQLCDPRAPVFSCRMLLPPVVSGRPRLRRTIQHLLVQPVHPE